MSREFIGKTLDVAAATLLGWYLGDYIFDYAVGPVIYALFGAGTFLGYQVSLEKFTQAVSAGLLYATYSAATGNTSKNK
ncbi:MAG: hypothetical protein NBV63_02090 [Candidatus Pacebacteria bacterium]|nr:hypothetical protein [Candidatus Paceibacterota bacterium]